PASIRTTAGYSSSIHCGQPASNHEPWHPFHDGAALVADRTRGSHVAFAQYPATTNAEAADAGKAGSARRGAITLQCLASAIHLDATHIQVLGKTWKLAPRNRPRGHLKMLWETSYAN
ncbi:hypothetical protein PpSQ1_25720, partial [Pseudomonas putida]